MSLTKLKEKLGYDPKELERELTTHYISASQEEIDHMLESIGKRSTSELYTHVDSSVRFDGPMGLEQTPSYEQLIEKVETVANKNKPVLNFLGDGLQQYKVHDIVAYICGLRGLTTAYTPYQPERSQGTLHTLWVYSSALAQLTGFEAINASLYERSTCLFEALKTGQRLSRKKNTVLVADTIHPQDKDVLLTLAKHTDLKIEFAPIHQESGLIDIEKTKQMIEANDDISTFAYPQINGLGLIEDFNELTDLANEHGLYSIAIIDPILLAQGGLKAPSIWGKEGNGTTMLVGEGQHLCLDANYGGPGLGIFGIRFNDQNKTAIRSTPGRYVGKAKDVDGRDALCMVLSTREQHIRREKATSNICSNQSFVATIAGAALIAHGDEGLSKKITRSKEATTKFLTGIKNLKGVSIAFPTPFYNEVVLEVENKNKLLSNEEIIVGKDISGRYGIERNLIKVSFSDIQSNEDIQKLIDIFHVNYEMCDDEVEIADIPAEFINEKSSGLKKFDADTLRKFYTELANLNVSPDDDIYPLGSCTMKYNPYINDWAASLPNFTKTHPDMPEKFVQGNLELLYEIQEDFKKITGLPGLTGQPVAGAQGELVGIKLFQAYHEDKGNTEKDIIIIPRSAHGTNPATAVMAGYVPGKKDGRPVGIITIDADDNGQMIIDQLQQVIDDYGKHIAGIMITNPNTSGVLEENFKQVADMIHAVDGLVYMDGANMNAIAGHINLGKLGVDAVHNNLHKTWTIPHGGGGPGDAIVAVSEKLIPYLPGVQIKKNNDGTYETFKAEKSIGNFHRHNGNFAHKIRAYTYVKALGEEGVKRMAEIAVLSSNYLYERLRKTFPTLPTGQETARMHEFIITLADDTFARLAENGTPKNQAIARIGKLFLDFGLHAPTVAFPEVYGLMIEPTESFKQSELDRFAEIVEAIHKLTIEAPEVLTTTPHFTPVKKVDEVGANKTLCLSENFSQLPQLPKDEITPKSLRNKKIGEILTLIVDAHKKRK
jgi:glycine dehydrogenase